MELAMQHDGCSIKAETNREYQLIAELLLMSKKIKHYWAFCK
jgi:hypothetical protein